MKIRPLSEAPREVHGSPIRLVLRDVAGSWISPSLYSWNGSRWVPPSGIAVPSSLTIVGWLPADADAEVVPFTRAT